MKDNLLKMNKHIILTAIFLSSLTATYSQNSINMIEMLNIENDIDTLEDRISEFIEINYPELGNTKDLRQFHVFGLDPYFRTFEREDLLNYSFLYSLHPNYFRLPSKVTKISTGWKVPFFSKLYSNIYHWFKPIKWKNYLVTQTYVTDSLGNLVCHGDALWGVLFSHTAFYESDQEFIKIFFDNKIDFAFYVGDTLGHYICIKNGEIFVIAVRTEGLIKYEWEEFIDCNSERFGFSK